MASPALGQHPSWSQGPWRWVNLIRQPQQPLRQPDTPPPAETSPGDYDPVSGLVVTPGFEGRYGTYDVDSDHWDSITIDRKAGEGDGILIGYHPDTDHSSGTGP